jgi:hypothetical protein
LDLAPQQYSGFDALDLFDSAGKRSFDDVLVHSDSDHAKAGALLKVMVLNFSDRDIATS